MKVQSVFVFIFLFFVSINCTADDSLLVDTNGDGNISVLALGDSITYGVGDTFDPEDNEPNFGGYPARLSSLIGLPVVNEGNPGEQLVNGGAKRFSTLIQSSSADIVLILEGANDAFSQFTTSQYRSSLQRVINITTALGKTPLVMTLPATCCEHAQLNPFISAYSGVVNNVVAVNNIRTADIRATWDTTCSSEQCDLYRLPEGLHPNPSGYDAMSQTIAASLLGINIFAPDGAANLESALGLTPGTVIVKPFITEAQ